MIFPSVKGFFISNLLVYGDWTLKRCYSNGGTSQQLQSVVVY